MTVRIFSINLWFIVLFTLFSNHIAYGQQYQYADDLVKQREETDSLTGKKFWLYISPKLTSRVEFKDSSSIYSKSFCLSEKTSFEIVDLVKPSHEADDYYKVIFEDGKVGFISNRMLHHYIIYKISKSDLLLLGFRESLWHDHMFEEDPDIIKARLEKQAAEQKRKGKKAEAAWKARGGVKIGMTKDQALKSNWGKPRSINKTTMSGLAHEQWVYEGGYLYFENGILTAIQN